MPKSCANPETCQCNVHSAIRAEQRRLAAQTPPVGETSNAESKPVEWEKVADSTYRLKVPGGWLYRIEPPLHASVILVPNPEY